MLIYIHMVKVLIPVGSFTRDTYNCNMLLVCAILADFYTTGMTVVLMGFALEPLYLFL